MPVNYDMTIDETIEYLEKTARHQLECAEKLDELGCDSTSTRSIADYHKQLAEWLRELKAYRGILANADRLIESEYGVVIIEGYKDVIDQMNEVYMEVNADE